MFRSSLVPGSLIELTVLEGDGEYIVRMPIGFDADDDRIYSLFVVLAPLVGYADVPGYKLVFNVTAMSSRGDDEHVWWDGRQTRAIIRDPGDRRQIRAALHMAVERLIDEAGPGLVSMTTHTADLPVKALEKFNEVAAIFRDRGFAGGRADPWHGHYIWMMERRSAPGTDPAAPI